MAHHPLTILLQKAFNQALLAAGPETLERHKSRRRFIKLSALVATGMAFLPACLQQDKPPRVAILGAGIAGLTAAWQLHKQGIRATVYEASNRAGGRMWSLNNVMGQGISSDLGAEFVDTTHTHIIDLVKEMGLELLDLRTDPFIPQTFYLAGKIHSEDDLAKALAPYVLHMQKDIASLPEELSYRTGAGFQHLDKLSISEYLQSVGVNGWLFDFLDVLMTREYGMDIDQQSAINFLMMFQAPSAGQEGYKLFGEGHEVFRIKGGTMNLTDTLYSRIKEQVNLSHRLTAINKGSGGAGYALEFFTGGKTTVIEADYVITTIPFTILRAIPINIEMPAGKRRCIDELGYGNSSKFVMGFDSKPWRKQKRQGYTFTDISFGCGWDSSNLQSATAGAFTVFGGGKFSDMVSESRIADLEQNFTAGLEQIYPGSRQSYNGRNVKYCWAGNPFCKAGYTSMKKGQWSTLAGWEAEPVGNIFFAGEQVSLDFQGYMNGAAKTGTIAADQVIKAVTTKQG